MTPRPDVRVGFFVLLLAVFGYLTLLLLRPFASFLLAAVLVAFLLTPAQRRLAPRVGSQVAALVLVAVAVGATSLIASLLVLSFPTSVDEISAAIADAPARRRVERRIEAFLGFDVPLDSVIASAPRRIADILVGDLSRLFATATDAFLGVVLFLFVLYYLLQDGDRLVDWTKRMVPLDPGTTARLVDEATTTTWAVLRGHVLVAFVQGIVAGIGLAIVGLPYVAFWTVVMMVAELFPVVGVAVVLGPAVLYLAFVDRLLAAAFLFVYGLTAVAVVDDYLRAYIVDRGSSLHSATVLVGVFGGVYAFGVMGLFYGPIVVGLFKALVGIFDETYVDES